MKKTSEASGTRVWLVLMKAHRALQRVAARSIGDMGLSDFAVLELLLHKGAQPVNTIGRIVELTSGAITTAVDRLEARGLVERGSDPNDRRARIVRLTPAGEALITEVFAVHASALDEVGDTLTPSERETLVTLLKRLGTAAAQNLTGAEEP